MKNLLMVVGLLFTVVQSNAREINERRPLPSPLVVRETLHKVFQDGQETNYVGQVTVNVATKKINVSILKDVCGHFSPNDGLNHCMAMPIAVYTAEVPLLKVERSCGSKIFIGEDDQSPRDGLKTTITVTDHSSRLCKDLVLSRLIVKIESYNPWTNSTSTFDLLK